MKKLLFILFLTNISVAQNLIIEDIKFTSDSVFTRDGNFRIKTVDISVFGKGTSLASVSAGGNMFILTHVSLTIINSAGYVSELKTFETKSILDPWISYEFTTDPYPPYEGHSTYGPKFNYVSLEFK